MRLRPLRCLDYSRPCRAAGKLDPCRRCARQWHGDDELIDVPVALVPIELESAPAPEAGVAARDPRASGILSGDAVFLRPVKRRCACGAVFDSAGAAAFVCPACLDVVGGGP